MSGATHISWADKVWNPVLGCTKVSAGCDNCYAIREAWWHSFAPNAKVHAAYEGLTRQVNGNPAWTNLVRCLPERQTEPLHWRKPCTIFVNSMSDTFHSDVPDEFLDRMFAVMARAHWHRFMVLTKRPERMLTYLNDPARPRRVADAAEKINGGPFEDFPPSGGWPLLNVMGKVSAEDQARADERIPPLLATPLARRGVSLEPLLGPIKLRPEWLADHEWEHGVPGGINLVIAGGESGPRARPSHPDWFCSLRDQCAAAGVEFHFKQWGEWAPSLRMPGQEVAEAADQWPRDAQPMARIGKKRAGRLLDGVEHNGTGWTNE